MKKGLIIKTIAIILVAAFCFCVNACCEANKQIYFQTSILALSDLSAEAWMVNESSRALFAVCALADYQIQAKGPYEISSLLTGTVFVGRYSDALIVGFNSYNNNKSLFVFFNPTNNTKAAYGIYDLDKEHLEISMDQICQEDNFKVDSADLVEAINSIR